VRENRTHGSEGGDGESRFRPLSDSTTAISQPQPLFSKEVKRQRSEVSKAEIGGRKSDIRGRDRRSEIRKKRQLPNHKGLSSWLLSEGDLIGNDNGGTFTF
jgi:hypothetical protein